LSSSSPPYFMPSALQSSAVPIADAAADASVAAASSRATGSADGPQTTNSGRALPDTLSHKELESVSRDPRVDDDSLTMLGEKRRKEASPVRSPAKRTCAEQFVPSALSAPVLSAERVGERLGKILDDHHGDGEGSGQPADLTRDGGAKSATAVEECEKAVGVKEAATVAQIEDYQERTGQPTNLTRDGGAKRAMAVEECEKTVGVKEATTAAQIEDYQLRVGMCVEVQYQLDRATAWCPGEIVRRCNSSGMYVFRADEDGEETEFQDLRDKDIRKVVGAPNCVENPSNLLTLKQIAAKLVGASSRILIWGFGESCDGDVAGVRSARAVPALFLSQLFVPSFLSPFLRSVLFPLLPLRYVFRAIRSLKVVLSLALSLALSFALSCPPPPPHLFSLSLSRALFLSLALCLALSISVSLLRALSRSVPSQARRQSANCFRGTATSTASSLLSTCRRKSSR